MPQWPKDPDEGTRRDEQMRVPPNMMIPTHDNNDNEKEKNQTSNQGAITKCRYLEIGFSLCFYCISNNTHYRETDGKNFWELVSPFFQPSRKNYKRVGTNKQWPIKRTKTHWQRNQERDGH